MVVSSSAVGLTGNYCPKCDFPKLIVIPTRIWRSAPAVKPIRWPVASNATRRVIWYSTPANVEHVRSNPVDLSKTKFTWGVKRPNKPFDERCRPKPAPKSQVPAGFDADEVVAPLQLIVAPRLLRPMSSLAMNVAP